MIRVVRYGDVWTTFVYLTTPWRNSTERLSMKVAPQMACVWMHYGSEWTLRKRDDFSSLQLAKWLFILTPSSNPFILFTPPVMQHPSLYLLLLRTVLSLSSLSSDAVLASPLKFCVSDRRASRVPCLPNMTIFGCVAITVFLPSVIECVSVGWKVRRALRFNTGILTTEN